MAAEHFVVATFTRTRTRHSRPLEPGDALLVIQEYGDDATMGVPRLSLTVGIDCLHLTADTDLNAEQVSALHVALVAAGRRGA